MAPKDRSTPATPARCQGRVWILNRSRGDIDAHCHFLAGLAVVQGFLAEVYP